jgi:serine/threonine protein kinase
MIQADKMPFVEQAAGAAAASRKERQARMARAVLQLGPTANLSSVSAGFGAAGEGRLAAAGPHDAAVEFLWQDGRTLRCQESADFLGEGTYGKVYRVTDNGGQTFAVKATRVNSAADFHGGVALQDLGKEFAILLGLSHPNVVRALAWLARSGEATSAILLELAQGTFSKWLREHPRSCNQGSGTSRWHLLWQAASGLSYIHDRKVLHADVKPANMLVFGGSSAERHAGDLVLKLSDFGLSMPLQDNGAVMAIGQETYSEPYRPSECLQAHRDKAG